MSADAPERFIRDAPTSILVADLVESMLSRADNPKECAKLLASAARSLVAVRTVLVFRCASTTADHRHELLSALPARRADMAADPVVLALVEESHSLSRSAILGRGDAARRAGPPHPPRLDELAATVDDGVTMLVPFAYAGQRLGLMVLSGLLDTDNIPAVLDAFESMARVFTLILRNAFLYENLESAVAERTARLEAERAELEAALEERKVLLREIHHRVKNNLQVVDSLLHMQGERSPDAATERAMTVARGRVAAMAMVHQELYGNSDLSTVKLAEYIPKLIGRILEAVAPNARAEYDLCQAGSSLGPSISIGLILNELVMNSAKYAFANRPGGRLRVGLRREGAYYVLSVSDDGPGLGARSGDRSGTGLGLTIIDALARQLEAESSWEDSAGCGFTLVIPEDSLRG